MTKNIFKSKTFIIIIAAVVIAGIGFAAGMLANTSFATDSSSDYITADRAKQIALESVGVTDKNAAFTKVEIDREENAPYYDLEFHTASCEYEFEIDALTGNIAHKDSQDLRPFAAASGAANPADAPLPEAASSTAETGSSSADSNAGSRHHGEYAGNGSSNRHHSENNAHDYIGVSSAKEIALHHAGVSAGHATFTDADLDTDDGVRIYEIDFICNNIEYEYDINAKTGAVISHESESLHHDD